MKKLLFILLVLISQISTAQIFGTYSYGSGDCTTILKSIQTSSQEFGCIVNNTGGGKIVNQGVMYHYQTPVSHSSYTGSSSLTVQSGLTGAYYTTYTFPIGETWYVRSFMISVQDTVYGETYGFTVPGSVSLPYVVTTTTTSVGSYTATSGGNSLTDGGATIFAKGVCYSSVNSNPNLLNDQTDDGTGTSDYSSYVTGLTPNTTYYIRSYARTSYGTYLGNVLSFTTTQGYTDPICTTNTVTAIAGNTATSGGVISDDGGATITQKGVCWNTTGSPTTANNKTTDGSGSASFTSYLTGLTTSTDYYVRAYAINSEGLIGYGDEETFTTAATCTRPEGLSSYALYANITIDGTNSDFYATEELAKQACWDYNNKGGRTITIGAYTGQTVSLSAGNIVYLGAATNCNLIPTGYYLTTTGPTIDKLVYIVDGIVQFVAHALRPTVSLTSISFNTPATPTNVSASGRVTSDGGATVTERGFLWNTAGYPTLSNYVGKQGCGTGTGVFQCATSPLTDGSRNWIGAYATNSAGTTYEGYFYVDINVP